MDIQQLRSFLAICEELHFGRAAQKLNILPATLSRHIRLLEESLNTRLFIRTTRNVMLTEEGTYLLRHGGHLVSEVESIYAHFAQFQGRGKRELQVGVIDSAAVGLMPMLLQHFHACYPDISIRLYEDKTVRLLPRLLSGRLDIVFVRPPEYPNKKLQFIKLFNESAILAVPSSHPLARRESLQLGDLAGEPMIVPDRRSRPHSHDMTMKLFAQAGIIANIAQIADEKQTIINLVAAGIGLSIVPRWTAKLGVEGVHFINLDIRSMAITGYLPLAAAYLRHTRDETRDHFLTVLQDNISFYMQQA